MEGEGTCKHIGMSAEHHSCNSQVLEDNPMMCGSCCVRMVGYPSGIRDEVAAVAAAVGEGEENGNEGVNKIDGRNNQVRAAVEVCGDGLDTGIDLNAALAVLRVSGVVDRARDRVLKTRDVNE